MTNAEKIRSMTDEELVEAFFTDPLRCPCDIVCGEECMAIPTLERSGSEICLEKIMAWLTKEAGGEDGE